MDEITADGTSAETPVPEDVDTGDTDDSTDVLPDVVVVVGTEVRLRDIYKLISNLPKVRVLDYILELRTGGIRHSYQSFFSFLVVQLLRRLDQAIYRKIRLKRPYLKMSIQVTLTTALMCYLMRVALRNSMYDSAMLLLVPLFVYLYYKAGKVPLKIRTTATRFFIHNKYHQL